MQQFYGIFNEIIECYYKTGMIDYYKIGNLSIQLLDDSFCLYNIPVNIESPLFLESLNLKYYICDSNSFGECFYHCFSKVYNHFTHESDNLLHINNLMTNGDIRIAISKAIAISLLHLNDKRANHNFNYYYTNYYNDVEPIIDTFARFLLLPPKPMLMYEFHKYYKNNDGYQAIENDIAKYISNVAQMPYDEAVMAWNQVRIYGQACNFQKNYKTK